MAEPWRKRVVIGGATKETATCRKCWFAWKPSGNRTREKCPSCGHYKDVRKRVFKPNIEALAKWRSKNPKYKTEISSKYRTIAMQVISGGKSVCARCGCNDVRLLEINHKNGGGASELQNKVKPFYIQIATLRRKTDDLELLCRVCNAHHYLDLKYGPLPFLVVWGAKRA